MAGNTGRAAAVDRDTLHRILAGRASVSGRLVIHQAKLAAELGVTKFTMSRIVHELLDTGRIRKLGSAKGNITTYIVADPDTWQPQ